LIAKSLKESYGKVTIDLENEEFIALEEEVRAVE
jgi:hypothetical protein